MCSTCFVLVAPAAARGAIITFPLGVDGRLESLSKLVLSTDLPSGVLSSNTHTHQHMQPSVNQTKVTRAGMIDIN